MKLTVFVLLQADCKNTLMGILGAVEKLIAEGFKPERTIILSFGYGEFFSSWPVPFLFLSLTRSHSLELQTRRSEELEELQSSPRLSSNGTERMESRFSSMRDSLE